MINKTELNIANKSYTNKDFASIYPELLELATKLTNKWDPSSSNESDPGVVLLKLIAFMGDKLNYNIDKAALEAYMPSATQESSMRKLTEMNGYEMNYYNSAITDVTFMYKGKMTNENGDVTITLPAFSTVITGTDNSVTYVLLERVELAEQGVSITKRAIEGTLHKLSGTDDSLIHLNNLDDNNRAYFPERQVATNGIFVNNDSDSGYPWKSVKNLNLEVPGTKCFKFGFDSVKNLPYIEFPEDIALLIEEGLLVQYIITQGASGNIKATFLNKLYNTTDLSLFAQWNTNESVQELPVSITDLVVLNNSSASNGSNPESIDEAYNNFKKTVGTFDTLVTPRDYANYIYNLFDEYTNSVVSNIQVADRRTDINYGNNILSFNEYGQYILSNENKNNITPFDLVAYPLAPIKSAIDKASYSASFRPRPLDSSIIEALSSAKTISHNFISLKENDIYVYKNYYAFNIRITTTSKVTSTEADSIINNVKTALYKNFNAREVDYGQEISFDTVFNTVQNADVRIKNISIDEPAITTKVLKEQYAEEVDYIGNEHINLLAKNIVAGRVSLFDYYDDFEFEFYQERISNVGPIVEKLNNISTEVAIQATALTAPSGYTLRDNEVIQLIGPNLTTKTTYTSFINFAFTDDSNRSVPSGVDYELKAGQTLKINYTESSQRKSVTYGEGTIIKTNFTLNTVLPETRVIIDIDFDGTGNKIDMNQLKSEETIEIRTPISSTLDHSWNCYWILDERNNPDNILFTNLKKDIILSEGESFIYTDSAMNDMVVLGSGTKLVLNTSSTVSSNDWKLDRKDLVDAETIEDAGLRAFSFIKWKTINFSVDNSLTIQEMKRYSFGKGVTVRISSLTAPLNNTSQSLGPNVKIEYRDFNDESFITVPQYNISNVTWEATSRLDINMGPNRPQKLIKDQKSTHTIILYYMIGSVENSVSTNDINILTYANPEIQLSINLQRSGGPNVNMKLLDLGEATANIEQYPVSAFIYNRSDYIPAEMKRNADTGLIIYNIGSAEVQEEEEKIWTIPVTVPTGKSTIMMFYWTKPVDSKVSSIVLTATGGNIKHYNQSSSSGALLPELNVMELSGQVTNLVITINPSSQQSLEDTSDVLVIGTLNVINGVSGTSVNGLNLKQFGFADGAEVASSNALLNRLKVLGAVDGVDRFLYNAKLDKSHLIEIEDLSNPLALFDANNVANQFTIAQLDVDSNSKSVSIVKASMR